MSNASLQLRLQVVLGCAVAVSAALLMWAVALSRDNWIALDAEQWNAWFPVGISTEEPSNDPAYTDVHYRVDVEYVYGQRSGRVTLRSRYNTELDVGPVSHAIENGWVSRAIRMLQQGVFKASAWKMWGQQWLYAYRWQEETYEYICPSQEIRRIQVRYENNEGLHATTNPYFTNAAAGWSTRLGDWPSKVNSGDLLPLLNPLAPIWPRLCGEPHFSGELYAQEQLALDQEHHRIWIPFPDEITDPTRTHVEFGDAEMDICAEQVPDGQLTCRLLNSGDSPARHALLLTPGRYRFFQRLHGEPQHNSCGNVLRGFGTSGPCNDGKRWYWRQEAPPHVPVEAQLQDLGPGTSVGPQITAFSVDY